MAVNLNLGDVAAAMIKAKLLTERKRLTREIAAIDEVLDQLGGVTITIDPDDFEDFTLTELPEGYNRKWVWKEKIEFVLNDMSQGTAAEIVDRIVKIEPNLDRRKTMGSISAVLSTHSGDGGYFKKALNERREFVYSLASSVPVPEEPTVRFYNPSPQNADDLPF